MAEILWLRCAICIELPGHLPGFHFRRQYYFSIIYFSWHPSLEHSKVLWSKYHSSSSCPVWNCAANPGLWLQRLVVAAAGCWYGIPPALHWALWATAYRGIYFKFISNTMSNTCDEYESKWLNDELVFPGFSRGLGSWRGLLYKWYISNKSAPSTYTRWVLEINFRVWPNDDMPCMGNTSNTEKVVAHFLLQ